MQLRPDKVQTLLPKAPLAPIKDQQVWNSVPAQEQVSSPDPESVCQPPLGLFTAGGVDQQDKLPSAVSESRLQVTSPHPVQLC